MTYLVQLHVFSGRPDPLWAISDAQAAELLEEQRLRPQQLFEGALAQAPEPAGGLGYRGFSLLQTPKEHSTAALVEHAAIPQGAPVAQVRGTPEVERRLLKTAGSLVPANVAELVRESIALPTVIIGLPTKCPACHGATAPSYDPNYWNNDANRRTHNNCYNYANDQATNTFAQPGRGTGHMYTAIDCAHVTPAAQSDGLVVKPNFTAAIPGWYVALVIWPGTDYHWYRQDKTGCWSHKPGSTAARNTDNAGHTISDPKTCNRGPYTIFCCYMATKKGVHIN